uniref:Uncharacterized protein n=1 Tax=Arundo donax TaxID=35708 RepID=A0A0A9FJI6_ARUDO
MSTKQALLPAHHVPRTK